MKLVTFQTQAGEQRTGAVVGDEIIDLNASNANVPQRMRDLLAGGKSVLAAIEKTVEQPDVVAADGAKLCAPVPDPQKVICIGLNYKDHAEESGAKIPREPVVFNKFASAVVGPEENIVLPKASDQVDYEAELVIVIGKAGRDVSEDEAMDYVAGYTIGHDVSARDWQLHKDGRQWLMGKTFDTFAPMGPALVTCDEVPDPHNLAVRFRLNAETMQDSSTRQMIFSVGQLVSYLSQVFTFEPGDVIFTGTPPGVGFARKPPVFLKPGDECEVEIEKLGVLRNRCVAAS